MKQAQAALIAELRSRLEELQDRIAKDSATSSLPPSRDRTDRRARRAAEARERREARKALGAEARKPGKQKGAPGSTLQRKEPNRTPGQVVGSKGFHDLLFKLQGFPPLGSWS